MLLQDVSVCTVLLYCVDIVACIVYVLQLVCSVLMYHALAEGNRVTLLKIHRYFPTMLL